MGFIFEEGLSDSPYVETVTRGHMASNGTAIRLFDHLGDKPISLEIAKVVETPTVTHLQYRVVK